MARFQHTVTLVPVPRHWFESCVVMLHDLAESIEVDGTRLRLPDGRPVPELFLVAGRHLRRGARYHPESDEPGEPDLDHTLTVLAWDRRRETALEVVSLVDDPHHPVHVACTLRLTSAERPRQVKLSVTFGTGGGRWGKYTSGTGGLHLDLDRWWPSTAGLGRSTAMPLTGTFHHTLSRTAVTVVPRPAGDGRWRVTVKARVRGRSFARVLLPVAMALAGSRARKAFGDALDDAAKHWNTQVAGLVHKDMEQLRLELVGSLFEPRGKREAEGSGPKRGSR